MYKTEIYNNQLILMGGFVKCQNRRRIIKDNFSESQ